MRRIWVQTFLNDASSANGSKRTSVTPEPRHPTITTTTIENYHWFMQKLQLLTMQQALKCFKGPKNNFAASYEIHIHYFILWRCKLRVSCDLELHRLLSPCHDSARWFSSSFWFDWIIWRRIQIRRHHLSVWILSATYHESSN